MKSDNDLWMIHRVILIQDHLTEATQGIQIDLMAPIHLKMIPTETIEDRMP